MIISTRLGYIFVSIPKNKKKKRKKQLNIVITDIMKQKFLHNRHLVFDIVVLFINNKKYIILEIPLSPPFTHGKT